MIYLRIKCKKLKALKIQKTKLFKFEFMAFKILNLLFKLKILIRIYKIKKYILKIKSD